MAPPEGLVELVDRFGRNIEDYRSGHYNETQVRREFVDPFFKLLGWDIDNEAGLAEQYKDVVHEDSIRVGGGTEAPDYCFRIGGARKFFVETKRPAEDIKHRKEHAYQLRRYAWSAKLPVSVLTDFEELAIYESKRRPSPRDSASNHRVRYFTYDRYPEQWDEIAGILSREAVLKGDFDRWVERATPKRGTAEVDAEFLKEIERWREALAKDIAKRNARLSQRDVNFAVQRTIDRIIFLRIAEDRGIEDYSRLRSRTSGPRVYERLFSLFREADVRYNSGLFHFESEKGRATQPDEITPSVRIDDEVLRGIIDGLYYPDCPYEFSVLPADILGQVYEQFLGKVIRLTAGHSARVEEKPEVRKAGGVYYTPTYIVDYIVKHTVGRLLEQAKTPGKVEKLRILDPACGSGSFLLGAYQFLLDWHLEHYANHSPGKWAKGRRARIFKGKGDAWYLTVAERKRILLANIYGVDIDEQAVEVTKLSLLLKVLEGAKAEHVQQMLFARERALPDLGGNVKCGNSLIGPDYWEERRAGQTSLFKEKHDARADEIEDDERLRVNAFDWKTEFPDVFKGKNPGFDAVIGNPPYVLLQNEFRDDAQLSYFRGNYSAASFKVDSYHLFMEQAIHLAAHGGRCSMITPANYLTNNYLAGLRRLVLESTTVDHIVVLDGGVFKGISVDNAVFVTVAGAGKQGAFDIIHAEPGRGGLLHKSVVSVSVARALRDKLVLFTGASGRTQAAFWDRIADRSVDLGGIASVNFGKQLRDRKTHTRDVISVHRTSAMPRGYKPCYTGRDVTRYRLTWGNLACLDSEVARRGGCWDENAQNARNKLVTRQIGRHPEFAIDAAGYQCLNTMFMVTLRDETLDPRFVLGILNSRLIRALWLARFYDQRRTFPKIKGTYLKQLPVHKINFSDGADVERHDKMVSLVQRILDLNRRVGGTKPGHERTVVEREIAATDRSIDELVYELYGLTDKEIRIVEEATRV